MKIIIIKSNLKEGISAIMRAAGENQTLPILKNALIEAAENAIRLTATNLEIAITTTIPGKVIEAGRTTAPIALLGDVITNLQSERLNIETKNNALEIKTDNYTADLQTITADEFPIIPKIKNTPKHLTLGGGVLREALTQTTASAQFSELRPELSSVFLSFSLDHLKLAATDSFRLSQKIISKNHLNTNHTEPFKILLPLKTAQEIIRVVRDGDEVAITHDATQIAITTERTAIISRLIDGAFPDYEYLIPKEFAAEITINREELLGALKLVGVFSSRVSEVRMKISENQKSVEISSADQATGTNTYILPGAAKGAVKDIAFNWRYLGDGLRALSGDQVFIGLNDDNKPAILRTPGEASYFYILMPILKT